VDKLQFYQPEFDYSLQVQIFITLRKDKTYFENLGGQEAEM